MNYLIGDIGNTNIKICKINSSFKIIKTYFFKTKSIKLENNLKKNLRKIVKKNTNKNVLFSSVVPNVFKSVNKIFKTKKLKVHEIKNFNLKKIMSFRVKKYSQLGSDRIANAIGVYQKFKTNCIIIDFGTATTFDVVKNNFVYDGGIIAPGIKLSIENLYSSAALLPLVKLNKYPMTYGKNTFAHARTQVGFDPLEEEMTRYQETTPDVNVLPLKPQGKQDSMKNLSTLR